MSINVYIHIGPPKTGTSAIQNWLQANTRRLEHHGVYYPDHSLDENGISSGNVLSVFDREDDGSLTLNKDKSRQTLRRAEQCGAHTLLLSSEFFFKRIELVFSVFPNAKIIAYLRDPMDVIESGYNQSVKRHYQTKPLKVATEPKTVTLDLLARQVRKLRAESFIIRPYDFSLFKGGNIVSDFLSILALGELNTEKVTTINPSYVFEALEFKRWMNQIEHPQLHRLLDRFLQDYRDGTETFSLVSQDKRRKIRQHIFCKLKKLVEEMSVQQGDAFLASLERKPAKPFRKQEITEHTFVTLLESFIRSNSGVVLLLEEARTHCIRETVDRAHLLPVFNKIVTRYSKWRKPYSIWLQELRNLKVKLRRKWR